MKIALITPSYSRDYDRCRILCESVARWVDPAIDHLVIIPNRDRHLFAGLPGRSEILTVESILPCGVHQVLEKWWLTLCSLPVRGWIMQQIVKLSAGAFLNYDAYLHADSDVMMIKPLKSEQFLSGNKLRLYKVSGEMPSDRHQLWHRNAHRMLGIAKTDQSIYDYIAPLASWRRDCIEKMLDTIQVVACKHWFSVLCSTLHFSEYVLYGVYVSSIPQEVSGHYEESVSLCHCSWWHDIKSVEDLKQFLDKVTEQHVAIQIQSNLGLNAEEYHIILKERGLVE